MVADLRLVLGRLAGRSRSQARSMRARTAAVATVIVGAAVVVGAVALVVGLRLSLENDLRTAARLRADDVADVLAGNGRPRDLAVDDEEAAFVQVIDDEGKVMMSTANLDGEPPVASLADGESTRVKGLEFEDDTFIVVAVGAESPEGAFTVMVGRNADVIGKSVGAVVRLLVIGVPVLLAVSAVTTWRLVGRTLSPVEEIRREVEGISAAALERRVPVPPTGDEVARLATTMNNMLARLEEAQDRQQRFVSDASHELRSPVTTIRHHAEVAIAHPEVTSSTALAEVVLAEGLRLQRLVDDLLWLARRDEGVLVGHDHPVDLDDLVLEELTRLRAMTSLAIDGSGLSGGRVLGEPRLLRQLLRNLTDNALRHTRTTVALSLREEGTEAVLVVEDDGAGIAEADRSRIFERFVRLDEARDRDSGGSGLGLAIASEIAAAHGGTIHVSVGRALGGARFELRLPAGGG